MPFDRKAYGPLVASLLEDGAAPRIPEHDPENLFPSARSPRGAVAGLWLYHGCLDEAHGVSQQLATPEGSFWHGIMHRREPDPGNAAYWFQRVGRHAIFSGLRDAAVEILKRRPAAGFRVGAQWDPFAWIDFWETARRRPGTESEQAALEIQQAEWEVLFDWCARPGQ